MATRTPWWKIYRQNQYKSRKTMTIEMIVRRSFLEVLKEYAENCSVSGVSQMCDSNIGWLQRIVRISIFLVMSGLVCYFFYYTWFWTLTNPLIISSESSTYPIAEIDFPAVALCNVNRVSKKALKTLAVQMHPNLAQNNETIEDVEMFIRQAGRLLDFTYNQSWGKGHAFLDYLASTEYDSREIVKSMRILAPSCSEILIRCSWENKIVDCSSVFAVRRTGRGHCCLFNYVLDYDSALSPKKNSIAPVKRQTFPGHLHGLSVVIDPLLDDYAYPLNNFLGFDVLLFDPYHYADLSAGRMAHRLAEPNHAAFMELRAIKQIASAEVRKYTQNIRKCMFKDEFGEDYNKMYSYSACIVRCRIKSVQSLCKCIPYFMPAGKQGPICTMDDLRCLNKYKEKLLYLYPINTKQTDGLEMEMEDSLFCPDCLPDCELTQHYTKSYKIPIKLLNTKSYFRHSFLEDLNMTNKCLVSVFHAVSGGVLDRLDVVAYWFEILSNFGGFGGVLIGISMVSVVEILYYFLVRFMMLLYKNYKAYH